MAAASTQPADLPALPRHHVPCSAYRFGRDAWDCRAVACPFQHNHIAIMCGRVIQSSGPLRYGIVEGMDMGDSRAHNYPPRWNAAPSQHLLVIRRNHETGVVSLDPLRWGLIPHWCKARRAVASRSMPGARRYVRPQCSGTPIGFDAASYRSTAFMSGRRPRASGLSSPIMAA